MVNVELPGEARGGVAVLDAELAARAVAVGVHRGLGHAELAGDLFGRQVLIDQPQAIALTWCEQSHRVFGDDVPCAHATTLNDDLKPPSTLRRRMMTDRLHSDAYGGASHGCEGSRPHRPARAGDR